MKIHTKNTAEKRRKEIDRQKWQKEKAERRQQRLTERGDRASINPDEDPDLAGIVPGPQPVAEATVASTETPLITPENTAPAPTKTP